MVVERWFFGRSLSLEEEILSSEIIGAALKKYNFLREQYDKRAWDYYDREYWASETSPLWCSEQCLESAAMESLLILRAARYCVNRLE